MVTLTWEDSQCFMMLYAEVILHYLDTHVIGVKMFIMEFWIVIKTISFVMCFRY